MKLKGKTIFNVIFILSLLIMPIVFIKGYDKAEELIDYIVSDRAYLVAKDMNILALSNSILYNEDEPIVVFDETVDQKTQDEIYASLKQEAQYYFNEYSNDPNLYYTYRNGSVIINSHDKKPFAEDYFTGKITYKAGELALPSELEEYQNYINDNNYIIYHIMNQYDINGHYTIQYPDDMSLSYAINAKLYPSGSIYYELIDEGIYAIITIIYFAIIIVGYGLFILIWPIRHEEEFPLFRVIQHWKFEILFIAYCFLYSLLTVASVFCLNFTFNNYLAYFVEKIDPSTIKTALMIINYLLWACNILLVSATFFSIKSIFAHGFVNYLKHDTLVGTILGWFKHKFDDLSEFDLKDRFNKQIVKFVLFNGLIILIINIFFPVSFIVYIIYIFAILFFIKNKADNIKFQYNKLLDATKQLSQGNIHADIDEDLGIFNSLKDEFNDIKIGFKKAVDEETKSQNMKTELISNVSHDLKTPLTCIKNYVYLLKEEKDPLKQEEYIKDLEQYTNRLNILIEDLFEVSKVNSGNISLDPIDLNIVSLLEQTLAECHDSLASKQLTIIKHLPDHDIMVHLDGDKTYRIFENLLSNISKYALNNSRVYLDILENKDDVLIIFKNISQDEMNFTQEEITERFIRGDKSRHESGSGLGLAIAKSFTEAQGGSFNIDIDGDLFKVTICFDKIMSQKMDS